MREAICQIASLIIGFVCMGLSFHYWGEELAPIYSAIAMLFMFVSVLFSNIQDKEDKQ